MKVWEQMETLKKKGLVRNIGISNMTIPKMKLLLRDAKIKPACNEMELHPHFQQPEFFKFIVDNGIIPIGFCPIGSPTRPDRDKTETDTVDIQDPIILKGTSKNLIRFQSRSFFQLLRCQEAHLAQLESLLAP